MKFLRFIKTKALKNKDISCFQALRRCIYHANNVKMPTIVGILTFKSMMNFILSIKKSFITSGPVLMKHLLLELYKNIFDLLKKVESGVHPVPHGPLEYLALLYDWRESCLLIGRICPHKSLYLPGNWSEPVHKLILHENQLELVSRS